MIFSESRLPAEQVRRRLFGDHALATPRPPLPLRAIGGIAVVYSAQEEHTMRCPKFLQLALCIALLGAVSSTTAQAQEDKWRQDLKPLLPPVVPLPPNSQLNPGSVGGASNPYTTAPLQQTPSTPATTQPAPGLRLTIPSR
jgi:hypothetical protein